MKDLKIFESNEFGKVRTVIDEQGEPWFVGRDIAEILEYRNGSRDINRHVDELDRKKEMVHDGKQLKETILINESGLYSLIFSSKMDKAREFKRWVTSEVLPSIRKHGAYMTDNTLEKALLNPDYLIELANVIKDEREKNLQLQKHNSILSVENEIMKPKADYFDELVSRKLNTNFRDTAKMLGIKESIFINWLIENKYIYRDKKRKLMPYSEKNTGLFEVKETMNNKTNWTGVQTLITPLGREEFRLLTEHLKEEEKNKKKKRRK